MCTYWAQWETCNDNDQNSIHSRWYLRVLISKLWERMRSLVKGERLTHFSVDVPPKKTKCFLLGKCDDHGNFVIVWICNYMMRERERMQRIQRKSDKSKNRARMEKGMLPKIKVTSRISVFIADNEHAHRCLMQKNGSWQSISWRISSF